MITPHAAASAPRTRLRRIARVGVVVVAVISLALAARLLLWSSFPPSQLIGWQLARGFGGYEFDPTTAQTTTVVAVEVDWPACAPR